MKVLFFTDIHGSEYAMIEIEKVVSIEKADKVVFLGDILYHGPRNPFPNEYNPLGVAERIKNLKVPHVIVKGNCDSEVDEMVLSEKFKLQYSVRLKDKRIICTHGHKLESVNANGAFAVIYGHFHKNEHTKKGSVNYVNLSSVSLPKENSQKAYAVFDGVSLTVKDFEQNIIFAVE